MNNRYGRWDGFPQQGSYPQGNPPQQGVPQQGGMGSQGQQPPQYEVMMPQPTYANGLPQPIKQPMPGSSTAAGFAGSKSFKSGIGSVLWLLFGWILIVGPIVAFFKGLSAVINGIKELIRSAYVGGFGTAAAIVGIVLGLLGGGVSGTGMFLLGRSVYIIAQAEMDGRHIDVDSEGAAADLFWKGEARYLTDDEYYGYGYDDEEG